MTTPVIQHLHDLGILPNSTQIAKDDLALAIEQLKQPNPELYNKLIILNPLIQFEYNVLASQLSSELIKLETKEELAKIIELTQTLVFLSEIIEHIHFHYLNVPREVKRLRLRRTKYKELLNELTGASLSTKTDAELISVGLSFSQVVRDQTGNLNWYRTLFARSRRVLELIDRVGTGSEFYRALVMSMNSYVAPILGYLSWILYLPRVLVNIFLVFKHTIPGPLMNEQEKLLSWHIRLLAQLERRWYELGNDIVWAVLGILNTFLFIGMLTTIGNYIIFPFYVYDIILAVAKTYTDIKRIDGFRQEYQAMLVTETDDKKKQAITEYISHFELRMRYEFLRLGVTVVQTIGVCAAMILALPVFAANPFIPLVGAIWLVSICFITWGMAVYVEKFKPKEELVKSPALSKQGFFAPPKKDESPASDAASERDTLLITQ